MSACVCVSEGGGGGGTAQRTQSKHTCISVSTSEMSVNAIPAHDSNILLSLITHVPLATPTSWSSETATAGRKSTYLVREGGRERRREEGREGCGDKEGGHPAMMIRCRLVPPTV